MGFGDSALKFELRFWSAEQDSWFQLQSDVTIAIAKALEKAGIEIPFPQRDLHVRSVDASVVERLPDRAPRAISSAYRTSTGGRQ
jgi:small-conductance mechanosensitive channel